MINRDKEVNDEEDNDKEDNEKEDLFKSAKSIDYEDYLVSTMELFT